MASDEELSSLSNGIWMCNQHSVLIDKNSGIRYPASTIRSWKALHEKFVASSVNDRGQLFGFLQKLVITDSSLFETNSTIEFSAATFLVGKNGSGKTAICDWLSSLSNFRNMDRWLQNSKLDFAVDFYSPDRLKFQVCIEHGEVQLHLDDKPVLMNHRKISTIHIENRGDPDARDDLDRFAGIFDLDRSTVKVTAVNIRLSNARYSRFEFIDEEADDGIVQHQLYCWDRNDCRQSFAGMSGGERGKAILEFGIALSIDASQFSLALLLVEWSELGIDEAGLEFYLNLLSYNADKIQVVITFNKTNDLIEQIGWQTYEICPVEIGGLPRNKIVEVKTAK